MNKVSSERLSLKRWEQLSIAEKTDIVNNEWSPYGNKGASLRTEILRKFKKEFTKEGGQGVKSQIKNKDFTCYKIIR